MLSARISRLLLVAVTFLFCCTLMSSYFRASIFKSTSRTTSTAKPVVAAKQAFATFLSTRLDNESDPDPYFTSARVLVYQLLHQPETRTRQGTPLVVIAPPHVSEKKCQTLSQEGATVIRVELLMPSSWTAHPLVERWIDQFTKLRVFSLTEYDRILYMDSDMMLTRPLDDIWEEQTVTIPRKTKDHSFDSFKLPAEYVVAGAIDNESPDRIRPIPVTSRSRLNGGFFVLKPDIDLLNYYISILEQPKPIFNQAFMEMGLLNHAHRASGPMPWAALPPDRYSNNWPVLADLEGGSATVHDKFWLSSNKDWIARELVEMWWRVQGRMEGYWQAKAQAEMLQHW